jgi:hypothetical protein
MATTQFTTTATKTYSANNAIVLTSVQNIFPGMSIVFTGNVFGNITANTVYFVENLPNYNEITISDVSGGYVTALSDGTGTMFATLSTGNQAVINTGAAPNDGTGVPLRTAFTETNYNFDQLFAAGPVGSNIQIANNSIFTINTNGNLQLVPNGIGIVQSNAHILPNQANLRNLGSSTQRWSTVYSQYVNSTQLNVSGDLSIGGNLTVVGNTIEIGNTVTDSLTINLGHTVGNATSANGAGITVGSAANIATILFDSGNTVWKTNVGLEVTGTIKGNSATVYNILTAGLISATGNITGNHFIGNGYSLTSVATQVTGSWTLNTGTNTVSLSVLGPGTYSIWINGNIPNGIVTYTATGVVTNNDVPVLGTSYGWYYAAGNALVLTSIPNQFVGTVNSISTANIVTTTANVFTFGITNNSGNSAVVNWGYTRL